MNYRADSNTIDIRANLDMHVLKSIGPAYMQVGPQHMYGTVEAVHALFVCVTYITHYMNSLHTYTLSTAPSIIVR